MKKRKNFQHPLLHWLCMVSAHVNKRNTRYLCNGYMLKTRCDFHFCEMLNHHRVSTSYRNIIKAFDYGDWWWSWRRQWFYDDFSYRIYYFQAKNFKVDEFRFFAKFDDGGSGGGVRGAVDDKIELIFTTIVEWYTICPANIQWGWFWLCSYPKNILSLYSITTISTHVSV